MKIAVQISGEFRFVNYTLEGFYYFLRNLPGCEVDVFIHTWRRDADGFGTFPWAQRGNWDKTIFNLSHGKGIAAYRPRAYVIENYDDLTFLHTVPRAFSMYYSIWRANSVRKEYEALVGTCYDLVIRYRTDCKLGEPLLGSWIQEIKGHQNFVCIPHTQDPQILADGADEQGTEVSLCDWLAWGTPTYMDIYCDVFPAWASGKYGQPLTPERMLAKHLAESGVTAEKGLLRPVFSFYLVDVEGKPRCLRNAAM